MQVEVIKMPGAVQPKRPVSRRSVGRSMGYLLIGSAFVMASIGMVILAVAAQLEDYNDLVQAGWGIIYVGVAIRFLGAGIVAHSKPTATLGQREL